MSQSNHIGTPSTSHLQDSKESNDVPHRDVERRELLTEPDRAPRTGDPTPLGLCAFALTTFILALIDLGVLGITSPNLVIGAAFGYGGLVQLLAGMWAMGRGDTFAATAFSSFGGFWISTAIILTPGVFMIESTLEQAGQDEFLNSFGIYLEAWFIFTFFLFICSLRTSVGLCAVLLTLAAAFLCLGVAYLDNGAGGTAVGWLRTGGAFALLSACAAWYSAVAALINQGGYSFKVPIGDLSNGKPSIRLRRNAGEV